MKMYRGACDGSAAVACGQDLFLAANDESDVLHLYRNDNGSGDPVASFDLSAQLREDPLAECDIEGAAQVEDRVYWIASHGRDGAGRLAPNRQRLFATRLSAQNGAIRVDWIGRYDRLAQDMTDADCWPETSRAQKVVKALRKALRLEKPKAERLAPKRHGLNIEGLAARPEDGALLIGLRNPTSRGRAIVIPLANAAALIAGDAGRARFEQPARLDLGGFGVRAIGYIAAIGAYLIVAGARGSGGPFRLYRWSGDPEAPATLDRTLGDADFAPEAIVTYGESNRVQLLGDAGARELAGGKTCKELEPTEQYFTDRWVYLF